MAKNPTTYWNADEVRDIAQPLIEQFHEHLLVATILYVFRSEATETKSRVVLGTARKVTGLNAYLAFRELLNDTRQAFTFYVIEIAHDTWQKLTGPQRIALVDHELSHIGRDGMIGHDVEEFSSVVARHGLWKPDLKELKRAMDQPSLFESIDAIRPKPGSGIESVTIEHAGRSVTLHRDDVH
jgi:predicted metallopeptidase